LDFSAQAAVLAGLNAGVGNNALQTASSCPSGNCRWKEFLSISVCSSCIDVSDQITTTSIDDGPMVDDWPGANYAAATIQLIQHTLPNGLYINNPDAYNGAGLGPILMTSMTWFQPSETLMFKNKTTLVAGITTMAAQADTHLMWSNWSDVKIKATDCALYFCVKRYTSQMVNGTLGEVSVEVASDRSADSWKITNGPEGQDLVGPQPPVDGLYEHDIWVSRTDLAIKSPGLADQEAFFNVSQPAVDGLISFLNTTLVSDGLGAAGWVEASDTAATAVQYTAPYMQMLWRYANDSSALYDNLAVSISSSMRNKISADSPQLVGELGTYQTFIRVRWPWVSLPCFCVGVGAIFLLLAIWDSHRKRIPLWKTSALATLFHGLESSTLRALKDAQTSGEIHNIADTFKVRLNNDLRLGELTIFQY
jgi:hypothetical protein